MSISTSLNLEVKKPEKEIIKVGDKQNNISIYRPALNKTEVIGGMKNTVLKKLGETVSIRNSTLTPSTWREGEGNSDN